MATNDQEIATILREFAQTLTTDFAIQGILDHLVGRITAVLPVTGAGVTLISDDLQPKYVSASDEASLGFELLQSKTGDGPCVMAFRTGETVAVDDLAVDDRFPLFGPKALATGLKAVFTFPLRTAEGCIGALDLYRDSAGPLSGRQILTAETMADVVAACLINAQAREASDSAAALHLHDSLHDPLTGLPNRRLLMDRLEQIDVRSPTSTAVFFADLDRFKLVNDHHGHHVGDQLLVEIADRLVSLLRPEDTVARISGDEFVILCPNIRNETELIASRIESAFAQPFLIDGLRLSISASVGLAIAEPGHAVSDQLLVRADTAMYLVKRHRGGRRHLVSDDDSRLSQIPQNLAEELTEALEKRLLRVAYQPIVRTYDSVIADFEALLRWQHPTRGPIPPLLWSELQNAAR